MARLVEIEVLVVVSWTVWQIGTLIMKLNGKSRMMRLVTESRQHIASRKWIPMLSVKHAFVTVVFLLLAISCLRPANAGELAITLRDLDVTVLSHDERQDSAEMISRDIERRRLLAIQKENRAWSKVKSRDAWERFRDQRLTALRESLGHFPL